MYLEAGIGKLIFKCWITGVLLKSFILQMDLDLYINKDINQLFNYELTKKKKPTKIITSIKIQKVFRTENQRNVHLIVSF